jgi:transposase
LRWYETEFDIVTAKREHNVSARLEMLAEDAGILGAAKVVFAQIGQQIADLDEKIEMLEKQLLEQHRAPSR